MIYKLMHQKLGGDDAYQSHVVLDADGCALAKFVLEQSHCAVIENAVTLQLFGGEQLFHVLTRSGLEKTAGFRCAIGLLVPLQNRRRNEASRTAFQ